MNKRGGFTLIELLIVIVILTILATIMVNSYVGWRGGQDGNSVFISEPMSLEEQAAAAAKKE